jgi:DNA-binding transcriptional regulator YiaG
LRLACSSYQLVRERLAAYNAVVNDYIREMMKSKELIAAREQLGLGPVAMSRAMGVSYETYVQWQSGRRKMPAVAIRCVELLLMYPKTAKRLGDG